MTNPLNSSKSHSDHRKNSKTIAEQFKSGLLSNPFNFKGRANRLEYLMVNFSFYFLGILYFLPDTSFFSIVLVFYLFIILQIIRVTFRRLHDLNLSGWWMIGLLLTSIPLSFVEGPLFVIPVILFKIGQFVILFIPGSNGSNQYGTNPLQKV
ncbi:MAG: hypothetical protein CMM87_03065 [Rickettsiales bacterium]|nr:hypothetical protein [Rickettsiales bacterium]|tara:strand:- start:3694 stop:4149 length:456 start_codon:yes stop_codon:yes gene_type:complete